MGVFLLINAPLGCVRRRDQVYDVHAWSFRFPSAEVVQLLQGLKNFAKITEEL